MPQGMAKAQLSMNARAIALELRDLASRCRRLPPPNHRKPDAFHEARSELAHDICAVADKIDDTRPKLAIPAQTAKTR